VELGKPLSQFENIIKTPVKKCIKFSCGVKEREKKNCTWYFKNQFNVGIKEKNRWYGKTQKISLFQMLSQLPEPYDTMIWYYGMVLQD